MAKTSLTDRKVREILNAGTQPNFAQLNHNAASFREDYALALDWIHHNVDEDDLRAELITYIQFSNRSGDVALVKNLDGVQIKLLGSISYCLNRGADLAPKSLLRITNALELARSKVVADAPVGDFQELTDSARSRNMEAYKNCYSRLDNLRALVCNGKLDIKDVYAEAQKILDSQGGTKPVVRKQLVEHYTQSVEEAQEDKLLKTWVKPLQMILRAVSGESKSTPVKVAKQVKAAKADKAVKAVKGKKAAETNTAKTTKKVAAKAAKPTRTVVIKPKRDTGVPSVASQVRELIRVNQSSTDAKGMVEIVVRELGLTVQRGKSVVKAFWGKVEA